MKKYSQGLGAAVIALGFLLFALIKNTNLLVRLAILPFIICSICYIAKDICLMLNKPKPARYFYLGFIISFFSFAFGFLTYGCYFAIKNGQYSMALFSVPFWIVAIYFFRVAFFKKKASDSSSKKDRKRRAPSSNKRRGKWSFHIVVTGFLVSIVLIAGIVLLFMGIKGTIRNAHISAHYESIKGSFVDYEVDYQSHIRGRTSTTYYLIYEYEISGEIYTVKTDYGTGTLPPLNSTREIKYDPNNPENAMVGGSNGSHFMLLMGGFFTLGGMVFVLLALQTKGVFDNVKFDILGTYFGFVFVAVAFGIVFFRYGETGSFITGLTSMGIFMVIPILFILAGGALMIKSICSKKQLE